MEHVNDSDDEAKEVDAINENDNQGTEAKSNKNDGIRLAANSVLIFFILLVLFSGRYALDLKRKAIAADEKEVESDLRLSEAAHLIEKVPACIVCRAISSVFSNVFRLT